MYICYASHIDFRIIQVQQLASNITKSSRSSFGLVPSLADRMIHWLILKAYKPV